MAYSNETGQQLGELSLWRIAMKPGKPVAYGKIHNTPFLGLPGNPVAVFVTALIFARPMILKMQGAVNYETKFTNARAAFDWPAGKRCEYLRARISSSGDEAEVEIYPHQGSGVLSSACWADGVVEVPVDMPIKKGDSVRFLAFT
jgi:molybdopterin molybdotransferase